MSAPWRCLRSLARNGPYLTNASLPILQQLMFKKFCSDQNQPSQVYLFGNIPRNFKILYEDIYKYSQNHLVNFIEKNILNFKIYKNYKSGILYNFLDYNNKLISITIEELKYIISSSIRIKFKLKPEYIYWIKKNDNNTGNIVYNITNISILNKDEKIILDLLELRNIHNKNKEKTDIISDLQYIYNNGIYFEKYKKYTSKRDIMNTLC